MVLLSTSLFDFSLRWLPITVDKADTEEGTEDLAMQLYMIELMGVMDHYSCEPGHLHAPTFFIIIGYKTSLWSIVVVHCW